MQENQQTHKDCVNHNRDHLDKYHKKPVTERHSGVKSIHIAHPPHNLGWIEGKDLNLGHYQDEMEENVKRSHIIGDKFKPTQDKFIKDDDNINN